MRLFARLVEGLHKLAFFLRPIAASQPHALNDYTKKACSDPFIAESAYVGPQALCGKVLQHGSLISDKDAKKNEKIAKSVTGRIRWCDEPLFVTNDHVDISGDVSQVLDVRGEM